MSAQQPEWKRFQKDVVDTAHLFGWIVAQFRPLMTKRGWRTPVSADGKGFPDMVLVGHDQVLYRELKTGKGRLEPEQEVWRDVLQRNGADWSVWTPDDWPRIVTELGGKVAA